MERRILIEIEEPDFMDVVNSEEKEELNRKVAETIRSLLGTSSYMRFCSNGYQRTRHFRDS